MKQAVITKEEYASLASSGRVRAYLNDLGFLVDKATLEKVPITMTTVNGACGVALYFEQDDLVDTFDEKDMREALRPIYNVKGNVNKKLHFAGR